MTMVVYFIAKFFEARADLFSAIIVGKPRLFADALEKIGYGRLLLERNPSVRFSEWLSLDPHPPLYFRIERLRGLGDTARIKHPLIDSARDDTRGFINSLQ